MYKSTLMAALTTSSSCTWICLWTSAIWNSVSPVRSRRAGKASVSHDSDSTTTWCFFKCIFKLKNSLLEDASIVAHNSFVMHQSGRKSPNLLLWRSFSCTVVVSCEWLPQPQRAVVCGGWHLALRHSCLPPPLFSALQWDHVVLLISQQWPHSLPFSLCSPFLFTFPHSLLSSSPLTPTHPADSASHQLSHRLYKLY